jgi:hypothetical protein
MSKLIKISPDRINNMSNDTYTLNLRPAFNQTIYRNDDNVSPHHVEATILPMPVTIEVYEIDKIPTAGEIILSYKGIPLIRYVSIKPEISDNIIEEAYQRLKSLPVGRNEIWPEDHNVHEGYHIADPWGEATLLLSSLEKEMDVLRPPENHNKLASKSFNRFALDELHIDSFVGMERDKDGKKLRIWRTFYNLGNKHRTTIVGVHNPDFVDHFTQEQISHSYLPTLAKELNFIIPSLLLSIPPRNTETGEIFGFEILTTNLLHGEYGPKDDYIAIINSLKPTERYDNDKKPTP